MPDGNGLQSLPVIARQRPGLPVIIISAQNTIVTAIQAAEAAAWDYLPKPFDLPDLMKRAARALDVQRRRGAPPPPVQPLREIESDLPLVGRTPSMQALYRLVARVMNADLPALITGESGTGKTLVAHAIHDFSDRRGQPFVTAQMADMKAMDGPSSLLSRARGGVLVFEEIADFDDEAQGRIVRMLDAMPEPGPRIIATSQTDLAERLASGQLRKDLYFRLGGVTLAVPPLRERVDDLPLLADHFLARAARDGLGERRLSGEALDLIRTYPWPGNVRQLENTPPRRDRAGAGNHAGRDGGCPDRPDGRAAARGRGREAFRLGRASFGALLRSAWRGLAAAGSLRPDFKGNRAAADRDRPGCDRRQSG